METGHSIVALNASMIIKFSELYGPEFNKAMGQLFHGHRIVYENICWIQIRRKKTLIVTCASRYSKDDLTQELDWIKKALDDLMNASGEFRRQVATLQLTIALVDRLGQNKSQICTLHAASYEDFVRSNYKVKWPLSKEEIETRRALRKRTEKIAAIKGSMRSIPLICGALLMQSRLCMQVL